MKIKNWINEMTLDKEELATDLLQRLLSDKAVREDLLNLLSFTSDDAAVEEKRPGSREAKSWALRLWWKVMYKPIIGSFMLDVVNRHNKFWVKREIGNV